MSRVLAFTLMRLLVAVIVLECILAAFLPVRQSQPTRTHISEKSFSAVFWTAFSSEGEKIEELAEKDFAVIIADLQKNFYFLSRIHATHRQQLFHNNSHSDYSSSILVLLCTFII